MTDKQYNESGAAKIHFAQTVVEAENLANDDIKAKTPFLLLQSGIAPIVYIGDEPFRKLYGVSYYDFGCSGTDEKISTAYNNVILKHLCSTYGKKWKKEIRKDVIGYKQFKRKNGC
ncbi:FEKKY domain-containing protein [Flavobacterium terrisoli]|uniref:FEKKY domain-containing protein n=1 Tax=Flavobacterium terrisoli TaxID=3242195 RepID=UPI002543970E|nr:hypothetical protein [Flavobacterium buctense]